MSWSNFEELKKFARKSRHGRIKRPSVGGQHATVSKRRRTDTDNGSFSYRPNAEKGEIEGFSSDEEGQGNLGESKLDVAARNVVSIRVPFGKTKCSKDETILVKRIPTTACDMRSGSILHRKSDRFKTWDFPNDTCNLLEYSDASKKDEGEIDCYASEEDDEETDVPQVFSDGSDSDSSGTHFPSKHPESNLAPRNDIDAQVSNGASSESGELINDFQSDQEGSKESLSLDISTPTPSPTQACPVVVGTPKTASQWLKQIQQNSTQKSGEDKSPEKMAAEMSPGDSAKKKRKFVRSGLAEQLQLILAREKSEKAFWYHRMVDKTKETSGAVALQSDGCITVQILFDQLQSSLHLTQCYLLCEDRDLPRDPQQRQVFVLFTCETWKHLGLQVGATVTIHPPWQKLDIPGVPWPVLLCTYFCEKQPDHQSSAVNLHSLTDHRVFVPPVGIIPSRSSTLVKSPKKGFQPSRLLFSGVEGACNLQNDSHSSSSTALVPVTGGSSISKPQMSILAAIDSCGGYSGASVTFQCLIQRVYRKRVLHARDRNVKKRGRQLLYQDLRSAAKPGNEVPNDELRWTLLVQDNRGMCAEIQVSPNYEYLPEWRFCIEKGEGKVFTFSNVKVLQRFSGVWSSGLFSVIQSLWPSSNHATNSLSGTCNQTLAQESGSQVANSSCSPNFCYVLSVEESSQATVCRNSDIYNAGKFPKPCTPLLDVLDEKIECFQRFNSLCKIIYCRVGGVDPVEKPPPSFELFVTDSSLVNALKERKDSDQFGYVRIIGKSSHVLPEEMRRSSENFGTILLARNLLLKGNRELIADTYSVIMKAVSETTLHVEHTSQDSMENLLGLGPAPFKSLSLKSCRLGYICQVEGLVIGVDEGSACCWLVCDKCGNADITSQQGRSPQFFCPLCNVAVNSPKTKTHLAVFLEVKHFPQASIKVTLHQNTIDKLLPVCYQDSDQGYDIEAVLGKQLNDMICYITERTDQPDGASTSVCLEEIVMS